MNDIPLISVIVPVWNVESYLRTGLNTITGQTWMNLEILLVDDGSTDSSGSICDEYARSDSRIRVIHQSNTGLSGARNRGLDCARGQFIYFFDPDDCADPDLIEFLYSLYIKHNGAIPVCAFRTDEDTDRGIHDITVSDNALALVFNKSVFNVWNWLFPVQLIGTTRFEPYRRGEDTLFLARIFSAKSRAVHCSTAKYYYRFTNGITRRPFYEGDIDVLDVLFKVYSIVRETAPEVEVSALIWYRNHVEHIELKAKTAGINVFANRRYRHHLGLLRRMFKPVNYPWPTRSKRELLKRWFYWKAPRLFLPLYPMCINLLRLTSCKKKK